jgi:riboflavin transporter FmnP
MKLDGAALTGVYVPPRLNAPQHPHTAGMIAATVIAGGLLAVVAAAAFGQARRGRYLGLGCLVGALCLSWGEALYDYVFHLTFYAKDVTVWSPFGIRQPAWVIPGYVMAYGLGGWWVAHRALRGGLTRRGVIGMLAVIWIACFTSETLDYHIGAFQYYSHSITVLGTPFWIETLNAVFIVVTGLAIAAAQPVLRRAGAAAQILVPTILYVVGFTGVTYGSGFIALDVLNSPSSHTGWMWLAAGASNAFALLVLWVVVDLLGLLPAFHSLRSGRRLIKP